LLSHSFTDIVMHSQPYFVDWALENLLYCIVLFLWYRWSYSRACMRPPFVNSTPEFLASLLGKWRGNGIQLVPK